MKKSVFFGLFVAGVMTFGSCGGNKQQAYLYKQFWYVNLGDAD